MSHVGGSGLVADAWRAGYAVPGFNVSNLETAQGVLVAAEDRAAPVILQVSPGAIAYAGYEPLTHLLLDLVHRTRVPAIVHLDHARDPEVVARAIADGYHSVMFDGSRLPLEDNVRTTRSLVAAARPLGVVVEAELGMIGGRADISAAAAREARPTPEAVAAFVAETGIDVVAPALGTIHGMPDDSVELDVDHLRAVSAACGIPVALHGGSGLAPGTLAAAIAAGVAKVNVSSRITRALALGIRAVWADDPDELDLRRFMAGGREGVREVASRYFDATGASGRAGTVSAGVPEPASAWEPE